jgi:pimeloyl-ACP methyl ester carboxylesterase
VIGFVGGFVKYNDTAYEEVRLAARLRRDYPSGVAVRIFENHSAEQAHREILRLLDTDRNGRLSDQEKRDARIVLFGHSWGASEAANMAWTLQEDGVPVLLTIQVDSVAKHEEQDAVIPANVGQAINFYQLDGFFHGRSQIVAADSSRTQILGNFRLSYRSHEVSVAAYPWYARMFMKAHLEIESDPNVWSRIEGLIRSKLSR